MASKIIRFPGPKSASSPRPGSSKATPRERAEALPDWLQELDVEWMFKEADRRTGRR